MSNYGRVFLLGAFAAAVLTGLLGGLRFYIHKKCSPAPLARPELPRIPQRTAGSKNTILAIVSHPDDEIFIGPLLARYAREGVTVFVVIVTDGQKGTSAHSNIPAGEQLAMVRAKEEQCSCRELAIQPPILLGFADGELGRNLNYMHWVEEHLRVVLAALRPDMVITWGPEGLYGHLDHRLVSAIVTQVAQRGGEGIPKELYYFGFPARENTPQSIPARWFLTDPRLLRKRVAYEAADLAATRRALACHKTQFVPEYAKEYLQMLEILWSGAVYLRPVFAADGHPQ